MHYNISIIYTLKVFYDLGKGTQRLYFLNWAFGRAPLPNYRTPPFNFISIFQDRKLKFSMHSVHVKRSTLIFICVG